MADVNQVNIVNTALALLGNEPVPDLSDASLAFSNAAVKILRQLDTSRSLVLRRHTWLCAQVFTTLNAAPDAPDFRYAAAFALPGDYLRIVEVQNPWLQTGATSVVPPEDVWMIPETAGIYPQERWTTVAAETDLGATWQVLTRDALTTLNVVYVRKCGWGAMDGHVADAVAFDVAARSAYAINGDMALAKGLRQEAEAKLQLALSVDSTQEGGQPSWAPSIPAAIRGYAR